MPRHVSHAAWRKKCISTCNAVTLTWLYNARQQQQWYLGLPRVSWLRSPEWGTLRREKTFKHQFPWIILITSLDFLPLLHHHLLLEQQDDVVVRLVGGVQVDHARVGARCLQHSHLVHHLRPAVPPAPTLLEEFGSEGFACGLLHTLLHHSKFAPDMQGSMQEKETVTEGREKRGRQRKEEIKRDTHHKYISLPTKHDYFNGQSLNVIFLLSLRCYVIQLSFSGHHWAAYLVVNIDILDT